jgi:hypothetical protein
VNRKRTVALGRTKAGPLAKATGSCGQVQFTDPDAFREELALTCLRGCSFDAEEDAPGARRLGLTVSGTLLPLFAPHEINRAADRAGVDSRFITLHNIEGALGHDPLQLLGCA